MGDLNDGAVPPQKQREDGSICAGCGQRIGSALPLSSPQRLCDRCAPHRRVYMYFFSRKGWTVQFLEPDVRTPLGRTRIFSSQDKILELIARTPTCLDLAAKAALEYALSNGRGGVDLLLTQEQYRKLRAG